MQIRDRIKELRRVKASELHPNPKNWRTHPKEQMDAIRGILAEVGFAGAELARELPNGSLQLIDGHARAEIAGDAEIPVLVLDVTESEANKILATFDPLGAMAAVNKQKLAELLSDLSLKNSSLNAMLSELAIHNAIEIETTGNQDPDSIPDPPKQEITKPGDLWILGEHRLCCGDCVNPSDIEKLFKGECASLCFTSPPYAEQRKDTYGGTPADRYPEWFIDVAAMVWSILKETGSFFVNIKEHVDDGCRSLYVMRTVIAMTENGWRYIDQMIWFKPGLPGGWPNRLKNDFEPIHFFTKSENINYVVQEVDIEKEKCDVDVVCMSEDVFHFTKQKKILFKPRHVGKVSDQIAVYKTGNQSKRANGNVTVVAKTKKGIARPGNVIQVSNNADSVDHPAAFPVKLPQFFMKLVTEPGDVVYEPFTGSGTSIIAAEQLKRRCYGMEISPKYCDLIIKRWEAFTGKKAVLEHDNR